MTEQKLDLRAGDMVEVRSAEEILGTLDERGQVDGMPFMPEMLKYSGLRFPVFKRADKTCAPGGGRWHMLRLTGTVHLPGVRCTGEAHGGCEAGCLLFWKEAWLKKASPNPVEGVVRETDAPGDLSTIVHATRVAGGPGEEETFSCQATEVRKNSPELSPWDLRQYARDVRSGNVSVGTVLRFVIVAIINGIQRLRDGAPYPYIQGKLKRSPRELLDLEAGELVEVKSKAEILATLHVHENNRGLSFDREMVRFCGRRFRVLRRVKQLVDEVTGKMVQTKGDCIILDGVTCESDYHFLCPRGIYPYWREIWLRRPGDTRRGPELPLPRLDRFLDRVFSWMDRLQTPRQTPCEFRLDGGGSRPCSRAGDAGRPEPIGVSCSPRSPRSAVGRG